jgi:hypothetical protein
MATIEFEPGVVPPTLTARSRKLLKDILQAQELAKFIRWNGLVGNKPNPDDPDRPWPWPWPGPPPWWSHAFFGDPNPQPNLPNVIQGELFMEAIIRSEGNRESSSFIDVIKREGIAQEALKELSVDLAAAQKSIEFKMNALG